MMRAAFCSLTVVLVAAALSGCDRPPPAHAGNVVDSVIPREEAMARFRAGLPRVDSLAGGRASRDLLVRDFARAVAAGDTATLRDLLMTKAEFAWLYYPASAMGLPPYDLSPALMWFTLEGRSLQGLSVVLQERGHRPLRLAGYACEGLLREGDNQLHERCAIRRLQAPGDAVAEQLFGPILERHGRFKFVSYANRL